MKNRLVTFLIPPFAALVLLAIVAGFAHAVPDPEGWKPIAAEPPGIDLTAIAAWVGAVLSLGLALALTVLRYVAPRTQTTWDDRWLARLEALEDVVHGPGKPSAPPRQPPSSVAGVIGILVIAAALATQPACATVERAGGAAKVAALECGKPQLATAAALVARWAVEDALAGEVQWAAHETDAIGFGLGVGSCAYAEFLRAWKAQPRPQALAIAAQPDPLAAAEAGLERLRARLSGAPIKLADGTVM